MQQIMWFLSEGTQVVTQVDLTNHYHEVEHPRGAVGVVVYAPSDDTHLYRVRFPDGSEAAYRRSQLAVLKQYRREGLEAEQSIAGFEFSEFIIFRCVVGSQAFGLSNDSSDIDRRGIYLPPAHLQWSLYGVPEQLENHETQESYWELQKFLLLALKANPNILECLYSPLVEFASPVAQRLLEIREIFLSKLIYQTYNGYVVSQFKKMHQDLRNRGAIKPKHAMHLIRLLLSGITALREGYIPVDVGQHREALLAIRYETLSWEEVNAWRLRLHKEFDAAFLQTSLPERPDYERANAFLVEARREMVENL
jgi:predicted nucleotidyltransferase